MGSKSDESKMLKAKETLDEFGVESEWRGVIDADSKQDVRVGVEVRVLHTSWMDHWPVEKHNHDVNWTNDLKRQVMKSKPCFLVFNLGVKGALESQCNVEPRQ